MTLPIELAGARIVPKKLPAYIAGIVNATPDSFWEESRVPFGSAAAASEAVERALSLAEAGADILDVGAESTRPGARFVEAEEELERLIPLIEGVRKYCDIPISVDTRKAAVMKAAFRAGADILNDVSALEDDAGLMPFCAKADIPVILMHGGGERQSAREGTCEPLEVLSYLLERANVAQEAGIKKEKIILDPGVGFGKNHKESLALIKSIDIFANKGYNVLVGVSRKSCIGCVTGRGEAERLSGSLAAEMYAVMRGAGILRVHDVKETRDMLAVLGELAV